MEATNSGNDFKHRPRSSYSENSSSSREGSSSNTGNPWQEAPKDQRRDHGKKRDRSRDGEWNRDRTFHGKNRDNLREEESRDGEQRAQTQQQQQQQQQTPMPQQQPIQSQTSFTPYNNYNGTEIPYVSSNRQAMPMMPYTYINPMNSHPIPMNSHPWSINSMESMSVNPANLSVNPSSTTTVPMAAGMDITQTPGSGINHYGYVSNVSMDYHGMGGMTTNYCQYGMVNGQENMMVGVPVREIINLSTCSLHPPPPNAAPPAIRPKPLGCKTVFVGCLPEKVTEEIVREIFEKCGEILTIRMSKKNFCHIRFASEMFVENAMLFSGYKIKVDNKDDALHAGKIHVDYANARDDQYEYECQQRAFQREARHRERMEQEYYRPPTPPPVVHYSEHEATLLGEKLRSEETFVQAVFVLITWLERGECNKRNAGSFYSMIQSTNSHVRRLMNEKTKYEEELHKAKMMLKQQMQGILLQFNEIGKVFVTACLQKVWDHFTKAQRKNIELWKKQSEEIKDAHVEEVLNDRVEDEMEVSEDEDENDGNVPKKTQDTFDQEKAKFEEELGKLREENDTLRCQLEAAINETMVVKAEAAEELNKKKILIQNLKDTLRESTDEIRNLNQKIISEAELKEFRAFKSRRSFDKDNHNAKNEHSELDCHNLSSEDSQAPYNDYEARLICILSAFLVVHPYGATIEYIFSYMAQLDSSVKLREIEKLLQRFPTIFKIDSEGIGAIIRNNWRFWGYESIRLKNLIDDDDE